MGRRRITFTEKLIAQRIRRGYGRGERENYKSWFDLRDFSSRGVVTRLSSVELGRVLLFLSKIELNAYLVVNWLGMGDYWEQYPMDREITTDIARRLGVKHPVYAGTKIPVVMTLDGVWSRPDANKGFTRIVLDSKPSWLLQHARTAEKLAIHAEYAKLQGWRYCPFTEKSLSHTQSNNLLWIRMGQVHATEIRQHKEDLELLAVRLHRFMLNERPVADSSLSVREYCQQFSAERGLPQGVGQRLLTILLFHGLVTFDLNVHHLEMLRRPARNLTVLPSSAEALVVKSLRSTVLEASHAH